MPVKITKTSQVTDSVKAVIYGESGVGKTVLISTAPKPIIISAEKGLLSIADKDLPVIEISSVSEMEEAYDLVKDNSDYESICIDSLSEIAEVILAEFQNKYADGRKAYGETNILCAKWIRKFRDIKKKHVFFTAKQQRYEDQHTGVTSFVPSMPGKTLVRENPYFFDEVLALRIGERTVEGQTETYRYIQTQPSLTHAAKDRSGKLKNPERPDLSLVVKRIMGAPAPKKKQAQSKPQEAK